MEKVNKVKELIINGMVYDKTYFDIFDFIKNDWLPDYEDIADMTINDIWDFMVRLAEGKNTDDD